MHPLSRYLRALLVGCAAAAWLPAAAEASPPAHSRVALASYWGGSGAEGCETTPGPDRTIYVTCGTDSPGLPRVGGIQSYQGQEDAYVARLDRTGRHIIYATYLGSPGQDEIDAVAIDRHGHAFVAGFAAAGFPTTRGAFDPTFNGSADCCGGLLGDAFVAELSADGSRLLYSTFLGGASADQALAVAVGRDGGAVVTGFTGSANFPTTPGAVQRRFGGGSGTFADVPGDGFVARLNPAGSRLVYSSYLGGAGDDVTHAVALDDAGDAYLTGFTQSSDFPATRGSLHPVYGSADLDGYATKLDPGGRLVWSTFLGGATLDYGQGIGVDRRGDVYVSGDTEDGFPITAGAAQPEFGGGGWDWFVAKLDRSGASLDWATYLGGSDFDGGSPSLRVDGRGDADVVGATASTDFPTTGDAFQPANAGGLDFGIVQLTGQGRLRFASYLGGSGDEDTAGAAAALDARGNLYFGGVTSSTDFPITPGAIQPAYGGGDIDGPLVEIGLSP